MHLESPLQVTAQSVKLEAIVALLSLDTVPANVPDDAQ